MTLEQTFFQLLQVAIGNRAKLSVMPNGKQWGELYELAKKQTLTAVAFSGVSRINGASDFGASIGIPEEVYLRWLGLMAKTAQRNKELSKECAKVCEQLEHDGVWCCVLKGQSNLVNYPEDLRECRTPGDIDLWALPHPESISIAVASGDSAEGVYSEGTRRVNYTGIAGVVEYAQQWRRIRGQKPITKDRVLYYHVEMNTDSGIEVELHYRPSFLCSPLRNHRLQNWFKENEQFNLCSANFAQEGQTPLCKFPIPTVRFNVVYQLLHIYKHLFEEGIGLRQLLDYYFVLRALHIEKGSLADMDSTCSPTRQSMAQWAEGMGIAVKSNDEIMHTLSHFGMKKFAGAVMYVLQTVFAMPDVYLLCPANEKEGKFLLSEIMQAGNLGKYDERIDRRPKIFLGIRLPDAISHAIEKTKHNLRLLTHYPEEVLCEPFFRVYHWIWRTFRLWKW